MNFNFNFIIEQVTIKGYVELDMLLPNINDKTALTLKDGVTA